SRGSPCWRPVPTSQRRTDPSVPLLASSVRPSGPAPGTAHTPCTGPVWPVIGSPTARPVTGFHSRTVPSAPALASSPSGGTVQRPCTGPWWPVIVSPAVSPVSGCHSRTDPSAPPVAISPDPSPGPRGGTRQTRCTSDSCVLGG